MHHVCQTNYQQKICKEDLSIVNEAYGSNQIYEDLYLLFSFDVAGLWNFNNLTSIHYIMAHSNFQNINSQLIENMSMNQEIKGWKREVWHIKQEGVKKNLWTNI